MNIKKNIRKKILVFGTLALFLGMTIVPTINAQLIKNNLTKFEEQPNNTFNGDNNVYDLIIITPKKFARLLKPLVCHKKQMGVSTKLVTLDEVYVQGYWGRDNPEKIKFYIQNAYDYWGVKYVLLVGGKKGQSNQWHLPVRYIHMGNKFEKEIPSDLYYADIYDSEGKFSSWDSDGDGKYGEWFYSEQPEDIYLDLEPDIAVGRLPCRSRLEVRIMVKKIIRYEKTTYNQPWFKNMIAFAGDTYPEYMNPLWVGYEGEYYADMAFENMTGFNQIKHYTSDGTLEKPLDILRAMNKGCGFVYFVGHGNPSAWGNHFANSSKRTKSFNLFHIMLLSNWNRLPVCVVSGCHNCQFDVSIFNIFNKTKTGRGEAVPECWGWHMTRKIGGGSIATIGCTALGFTKEDKVSFDGGINELEVEFFKQYGQNNVDIIGDTWKAALTWYTNTYPVNWETELTNDSWVDTQVSATWVLFGDPSLKIGGYPPDISQ